MDTGNRCKALVGQGYNIDGQSVRTMETGLGDIPIEALRASVYPLRLYGDNTIPNMEVGKVLTKT